MNDMEKLYTGAINDVLREFCLVDQALPPEIHPLRDEMKICGIAYTIRSSKDPLISGEMDTRAKMLDEMPRNCICVWDTGGETEAAHWGEIMTAASVVRGARGAVIDGGLRDTKQVLAQGVSSVSQIPNIQRDAQPLPHYRIQCAYKNWRHSHLSR